jgi:hypothetical protein
MPDRRPPPGMRLGDIPASAPAELRKIDEILREAGFEYPLGWRGVQDMANQLVGLRDDMEGKPDA